MKVDILRLPTPVKQSAGLPAKVAAAAMDFRDVNNLSLNEQGERHRPVALRGPPVSSDVKGVVTDLPAIDAKPRKRSS